MSTAASNYDVPKLFLGTALAIVSSVFAFLSLNKITPITSTGIAYTLLLVLYGVLMFASSYVEEEHNFWYWTASGWFFYLFIIQCVNLACSFTHHDPLTYQGPAKNGSTNSSSTPPSSSS
jgi:hypothetical protein